MALRLVGIEDTNTRQRAIETLNLYTRELVGSWSKNLQGIIVSGSSVIGGSGGWMPKSDFDLFAITTRKGGQERVVVRGDFEVTTFFEDRESVEKAFQQFDYPWKLRMFAHSEILYDPCDVMKDLSQYANEIWSKGRPKAKGTDLMLARHKPVSALRDAEDQLNRGDLATANLVMTDTFNRLMVSYDAINGYWPDKDKYRLAMLEETNPCLALKAKQFLGDMPVRDKFNLLVQMIDDVLEPVGGHLYGSEWKTSLDKNVFW